MHVWRHTVHALLVWLSIICVYSLRVYYSVVFKMEAEQYAEAIANLERRERILIMELKDVLTDISTPDSSDVEDNEVKEIELPQVRDALMRVVSSPLRWTEYSGLYELAEYRAKAKLKVRFAKKLVKTVQLGPLLMSQDFITSLQRVELTYPDDGGRTSLNSLVAIHNLIKSE